MEALEAAKSPHAQGTAIGNRFGKGVDFALHGGLDLLKKADHELRLAPIVGKPRPHFVDRGDCFDMDAIFDCLDDAVVKFDLFRRLGRYDDNARAHDSGVTDPGSGLHSECLCLITRGDAAARLGHDGCDSNRPPAKRGFKVLFDRREVAVAVDEKGGQWAVHGPAMVAPGADGCQSIKCSCEQSKRNPCSGSGVIWINGLWQGFTSRGPRCGKKVIYPFARYAWAASQGRIAGIRLWICSTKGADPVVIIE